MILGEPPPSPASPRGHHCRLRARADPDHERRTPHGPSHPPWLQSPPGPARCLRGRRLRARAITRRQHRWRFSDRPGLPWSGLDDRDPDLGGLVCRAPPRGGSGDVAAPPAAQPRLRSRRHADRGRRARPPHGRLAVGVLPGPGTGGYLEQALARAPLHRRRGDRSLRRAGPDRRGGLHHEPRTWCRAHLYGWSAATGSAVDDGHASGVVSSPGSGVRRKDRVQRGELLGGEAHVDRRGVLLQAIEVARSRDRDDVRAA